MPLTKMQDRPLDGRTLNMSISHKAYVSGLEKLREQAYMSDLEKLRERAKKEKKKLLTNDGIEDYRSGKMQFIKGSMEDAKKMIG